MVLSQYGFTVGDRVEIVAGDDFIGELGTVVGFELNQYQRPLVQVRKDNFKQRASVFYPHELAKRTPEQEEQWRENKKSEERERQIKYELEQEYAEQWYQEVAEILGITVEKLQTMTLPVSYLYDDEMTPERAAATIRRAI